MRVGARACSLPRLLCVLCVQVCPSLGIVARHMCEAKDPWIRLRVAQSLGQMQRKAGEYSAWIKELQAEKNLLVSVSKVFPAKCHTPDGVLDFGMLKRSLPKLNDAAWVKSWANRFVDGARALPSAMKVQVAAEIEDLANTTGETQGADVADVQRFVLKPSNEQKDGAFLATFVSSDLDEGEKQQELALLLCDYLKPESWKRLPAWAKHRPCTAVLFDPPTGRATEAWDKPAFVCDERSMCFVCHAMHACMFTFVRTCVFNLIKKK